MFNFCGVFGLPASGKSTLLKILVESSKELIACISSGDIARKLSTEIDIKHMAVGNLYSNEDKLRAEILTTIQKRRAGGASLIIIDGFPRWEPQVMWCLEQQLIGGPGDGCLVKVMGDNLYERVKNRNRDAQDDIEAFRLKCEKQEKEIYKMENLINKFAIPYYTLQNTRDPATTVKTFAKYLGLRK